MSEHGPDMHAAAAARQAPRPAQDLQGRDPVDPPRRPPMATSAEAAPSGYTQRIFRLQEPHDRILRRMHEELGFKHQTDTLRWILDNLCQPYLEGQIAPPAGRP